MGDTLKRKLDVAAITITHCDIEDEIKNGMQHDLEDQKVNGAGCQRQDYALLGGITPLA